MPHLTYWDSTGKKILKPEVSALKTILKLLGAKNIKHSIKNCSIEAEFEDWKTLEKASLLLHTLDIFFNKENIEFSHGKVKF